MLLQRTYTKLKEDGLVEVVRLAPIYLHETHLIEMLPRRKADLSGVTARSARLFDSLIPWRDVDRPFYESGIANALVDQTNRGDVVTIVGGGWGVTAVKASETVGMNGSVYVYEGSKKNVDYVNETISLNNTEAPITVKHRIVGEAIALRGAANGAQHVSADELPPSTDVLVLDCEGAEEKVLSNIECRPRVLIVESHGFRGAPSSEVKKLMKELGYDIVSTEVADRGRKEMCQENDVFVIAGVI